MTNKTFTVNSPDADEWDKAVLEYAAKHGGLTFIESKVTRDLPTYTEYLHHNKKQRDEHVPMPRAYWIRQYLLASGEVYAELGVNTMYGGDIPPFLVLYFNDGSRGSKRCLYDADNKVTSSSIEITVVTHYDDDDDEENDDDDEND